MAYSFRFYSVFYMQCADYGRQPEHGAARWFRGSWRPNLGRHSDPLGGVDVEDEASSADLSVQTSDFRQLQELVMSSEY